jgi:hypothetical protein
LSNNTIQGTSYTNNAAITTAELRNPDTNTAFYVTMHAYSPSSTLETFKLNVNTSEGACEYQARRAMHGIMSNGL